MPLMLRRRRLLIQSERSKSLTSQSKPSKSFVVSSSMCKLSREELVFGFERINKGLRKVMDRFEDDMTPGIADELLRLWECVELKSADIPSVRRDFGVDQDKDSLLGEALGVLEILQTSGSCQLWRREGPTCRRGGRFLRRRNTARTPRTASLRSRATTTPWPCWSRSRKSATNV